MKIKEIQKLQEDIQKAEADIEKYDTYLTVFIGAVCTFGLVLLAYLMNQ